MSSTTHSSRRRSRRLTGLAAIVLVTVTAASCIPPAPATGRGTNVRRVELMGDSLSWGLFGTTPRVDPVLQELLAPAGITLTMDGGPGDNPYTLWPWATHARWADQLRSRIATTDPDMVIIQSVLFPGGTDPANQQRYRAAFTELVDIAQSRGAHVYVVAHHRPNSEPARTEADIAERIQGEVIADRGVAVIPLNWWLDRCKSAYTTGGWHLAKNGVNCWAAAANAAVNQLRNAVG
ncbi:MAG: hypothetical protein R2698_07270 [Microthrixaceae bacterium]